MVGKTENINMNMYKRLKTATTHTRAVWATGHESSDSPGQGTGKREPGHTTFVHTDGQGRKVDQVFLKELRLK